MLFSRASTIFGACWKQKRWLGLTLLRCFWGSYEWKNSVAFLQLFCSADVLDQESAFFLFILCFFHDCRQKKEELSQRIAEERARREEEARRQEDEKKRKDAEEEREKEERLRRQAEEREQKEREEMERIQKQVCSPLGISVQHLI